MNTVDAGSVKAKLNPHPQQRYELTFTIHDAPGAFDSVAGRILYEVANDECVPSDLVSGGKSRAPGLDMPIHLVRINDNIYKGQVAIDLPIDEDYFGLGVCHWRSGGSYLNMMIHGVTFSADISQADIEKQNEVSIFFPKAAYFDTESKGRLDGGVPANYVGYVKGHAANFFAVAAISKRISP